MTEASKQFESREGAVGAMPSDDILNLMRGHSNAL
jgi:hypothetical protein